MGLKPTTLVLLIESSMTCSSHRECGSVTEFIWSRSFSINAPQCSLFHSSCMYGKKEFHTNHKSFQGHQKWKERKGKKGKQNFYELHTLYAYYIFAKAQAIQVGNGKFWGSSLGLWLQNILIVKSTIFLQLFWTIW